MTNRKINLTFIILQKLIIVVLITCISKNIFAQQPIRVVIAGLNHDHVHGILNQYGKKSRVLLYFQSSGLVTNQSLQDLNEYTQHLIKHRRILINISQIQY